MRWTTCATMAGVSAAALAVSAGPAGADVTVGVVARSGEAAPGFATTYSGFYTNPVINGLGEVVFSGDVTGGGDNTAIWKGVPGGVSLVAKEAAGSPDGFTSVNPNTMHVDDAGQVVFFANTNTGSATNDTGLWVGSNPATLVRRAREGDAAPGTSGFFAPFDFNREMTRPVSNGGRLVLAHATTSTVGGATTGSGLWSSAPGGVLGYLHKTGDTAPGTPTGGQFGNRFYTPAISGTGAVAFKANVQGVDLPGPYDTGLWVHSGGTTSKIARSGDPVPGGGASFWEFDDVGFEPGINDAGKVAFLGFLFTGATTNDRSIHSYTPGVGLQKLAIKGEAAPGTTGVFNAFGNPFVGSDGDAYFYGRLRIEGDITADNNDGIWTGTAGNVSLLVKEGQQAPGADAGVTFSGISSQVSVNDDGQVLFTSALTGPGVTEFVNDSGIYLYDPSLGIVELARTGELLGDLGTLNYYGITLGSGGEDGRSTALSDDGLVTFYANYGSGATAGSAIVTVAVPEPSSLGLLTLGGVALLRRRRA